MIVVDLTLDDESGLRVLRRVRERSAMGTPSQSLSCPVIGDGTYGGGRPGIEIEDLVKDPQRRHYKSGEERCGQRGDEHHPQGPLSVGGVLHLAVIRSA